MGKKKQGIGRSIIRDRFGRGPKPKSNDSFLHTSELDDGYDWGRLNLQSVTEQSNLDDFLSTAELAGTEFTAEKLNIKIVDPKRAPALSALQKEQIKNAQDEHRNLLRIPRRPKWDENTTAEELDMTERNSFLDWRRKLASLQDMEHIVMTPYEKNLDFWRQLWRVIERSDIIVQIVDGRNPLLFRCEDVEKYVNEVDPSKVNLVLVNKADYLTADQRHHWSRYFTKHNTRVVFWSALFEAERQKEEAMKEDKQLSESLETKNQDVPDEEIEEMQTESSGLENEGVQGEQLPWQQNEETDDDENRRKAVVTDSSDKDDAMPSTSAPVMGKEVQRDKTEMSDNHIKVDCSQSEAISSQDVSEFNSPEIVSGPELLKIFRNLHQGKKFKDGVTTVGMIGYPNVGKSSTINAILQMKKVPVSATPGRTKHFQTLFVEPSLMLCDCPGLVFPSFVSTKADLVVNGILPIDQLRDHIAPTSLICERIPRLTLETTYGIHIPLPEDYELMEDEAITPTAHELLCAHGLMRGFMTANGLPDEPRSSRYILKDYVNGKLLYCHPPPDVAPDVFKPTPAILPKNTKSEPSNSLDLKLRVPPTTSLDKEFFKKGHSTAHSKGARGVSGYVRTQGIQHVSSVSSQSSSPYSSQTSINEKPWKMHNKEKRNKREKLRRVYSHLDQ